MKNVGRAREAKIHFINTNLLEEAQLITCVHTNPSIITL